VNVSVVDMADALLAAAVQRRTLAVLVEPTARGHEVLVETPQGMAHALVLDAARGEAVVARVALVVGLDVAATAGQLGRVTVSAGGVSGELVAMTFHRGAGRGFEVRRLVGAEDALHKAAPSPGPIAQPPTGQDTLGAYRLVRRLGEGGMGAVYEGEHMALRKAVAIKVLHPEVARDPRLATTLLREGRLASRAHHPGIIDVTDFGTTQDGRTYLVMELCDWPTLRDVLRTGPLPAARTIAVARQILAALGEAHREGVVHRDLKPANVFLGPEDQVKIGDFGTARALRPGESGVRDTREGTVSGSPDYMSPEHCRGQPTDRRTDIYALGCMMFEMLTGAVPFESESPITVMLMQVSEAVPALVSPAGAVPEPLAATVKRALQKSADARYQTAYEMIDDLDRAAEQMGAQS
jgi:serine/threonine protein kinase